MRKYSGFNLAEVLITLGIIGIISALTIPGLISSYQKKVTGNRLKQAYAILTNALKLGEEENASSPDITVPGDVLYEHDAQGVFAKYFATYMAGATLVRTTYKEPYPVKNSSKTYALWAFGKTYHTMNNGMNFYMMNYGRVYWYILVDLNGKSAPNRVGHDIFYFALHTNEAESKIDGLVYRINKNSSIDELYTLCNRTATSWANGSSCTEIIKRNNWKIPNDRRYPW